MEDSQRMLMIVGASIVILFTLWWWQMPAEPIIASGHPQWPPIMYQDNNKIAGVGPALVKKILVDDKHLKVVFPYSGSWENVQGKAKSGDVDILVAAYKTAEREEYMLYSEPYTTDPIVLYVKAGKTYPFTNWDDLTSKRGVAMVGDSYGQKFDDFMAQNLENKIQRVRTSEEAFNLIISGQADYFIYSLYAGNAEIKRQHLVGQVVSLPQKVTEENFYITISKRSPFTRYLPAINQGIAKYKANGTITRLLSQYQSQ